MTEIAREGARQMLAAALKAEAASFVAQFGEERLPDGRQHVVRHGMAPEREIQTGIGPIPVQRQKVRDRATDVPAEAKIRFTSTILPRWARRSAAQEMAERRRAVHRNMVVHPTLKLAVVDRLKAGWSPEQIAERMKLERHPVRVSHETIYRFAYSKSGLSGELYRHLPEHRRRRRRRTARRHQGVRFMFRKEFGKTNSARTHNTYWRERDCRPTIPGAGELSGTPQPGFFADRRTASSPISSGRHWLLRSAGSRWQSLA